MPTAVLVAPDAFKGTHTAAEVAQAMAAGLRQAGREVDLCPVADGGEGTLDALADALGAQRVPTPVHGPLGRAMDAVFALHDQTAIVETAAASGLHLLSDRDRDPIAASTAGTGELIAAALDAGATTVLLGVGGSATTDGGAGAIGAIEAAGGLRGAKLVVLCDVRTPFEHAARVFGPQKGADPDQVKKLSSRLNTQARGMRKDPRGIPYTGAAGGLAGGLWARYDAELRPGAPYILDALDFDARMRAARAVLTGEGRLDRQSLAGKAVSEVATRARQAGIPCHALVGHNDLDAFDQRILDLQAIREASSLKEIERAAQELSELI